MNRLVSSMKFIITNKPERAIKKKLNLYFARTVDESDKPYLVLAESLDEAHCFFSEPFVTINRDLGWDNGYLIYHNDVPTGLTVGQISEVYQKGIVAKWHRILGWQTMSSINEV